MQKRVVVRRLERDSFALVLVCLLVIAGVIAEKSLAPKWPLQLPLSVYDESSVGLRLFLSINSSRLQSGQSIAVTIWEFNPLARPIDIPSADNWAVKGLTLGPCTENSPMGLAVYQGNHTLSDLSRASPLKLFKPGVYMCPRMQSYSSYMFPVGSSAFVGVWHPNATVSIGGFWISWFADDFYVALTPGVYTVAGGDEWGTIVLLHFIVLD